MKKDFLITIFFAGLSLDNNYNNILTKNKTMCFKINKKGKSVLVALSVVTHLANLSGTMEDPLKREFFTCEASLFL